MHTIEGAREHAQVRKVAQHRCGDRERAVAVVDRQHEHLRIFGARGFEQIEPRGIAVVDAIAELAQRLDLLGVMIEHDGAAAVRLQQAHDRHAEPAMAGDDDLGAAARRSRRPRACRLARREARLQQLVVGEHQQRRQRHRDRHGRDEQARLLGADELRGRARTRRARTRTRRPARARTRTATRRRAASETPRRAATAPRASAP